MPDLDAGVVRPILKWAGGKRQLLPELRPFYPAQFTRYLEPFLGSGAVFLDLYNLGLLRGRTVVLSDINADIIGCYRAVRDEVGEVITALRELERDYQLGGDAHFYGIRDRAFNPARRHVHARPDPAAAYTPRLAAMLIFLNRTGYNGLFRLNSRGDYNVPAGRYSNPTICDEANLRAWSQALGRPGVTLRVAPFDEALREAGQDDFVYLDPPYAPVSATARFTSYTSRTFGSTDQQRLQQLVVDLVRRGCHVVVSNSTAKEIERLYDGNAEARAAGLHAHRAMARRSVNSDAGRRGPVAEYLITNIR